jgi:S1-C subfamily serine protease
MVCRTVTEPEKLESKPMNKPMNRFLVSSIASVALLLAACTSSATDPDRAETRALPTRAPNMTSDDPVADVVDQVLPSVVNVKRDGGEGTGFIVREDGIIVTNFHVVERASELTVFTSDEDPEQFDARVIGGDIQADLAVLDVDAEGLPAVPLGDSDELRLGEQVVALGYALGLEGGPSVTSGIVSSLSRRITVPDQGCTECPNGQRVYTDVIQTDAAINPGNSGGPLVDMAGNVIGINSAGTSSAENIGFAIQINSVTPTITQAAEEPGEPVAFMGIGSTDASDPNFRFQYGTPVEEGAGIVNVVPGGPADEAGVELGDVVVSFSGESIPDSETLGEVIRSHDPGDTVEVEVVRATGERVTLTVILGVNPAAIA